MGRTQTPQCATEFRIVCLGGSTGALHAYIDILKGLRPDTGMAFVIVSHRGIRYAHLLREILSSRTAMRVLDVEEGMHVLPNHVFIAPPCTDVTLDAGCMFHLAHRRYHQGWPTTISTFLQSLAANAGRRGIAVILSGKDYDGSSAMSLMRAAGGTNMAQSNAPSPEMPAAAVGTGCVDFYLPSAEIAGQLLEIAV